MIVLLYGPHTYMRDEKARDIIDAKRAIYPDAPHLSVSGDDVSVMDRIELFIFESGLFAGGKRIALVRNPGVLSTENPDLWKRICVRAQHDDILLILSQHATTKTPSHLSSWVGGVEYKAYFFDVYSDRDARDFLIQKAQILGGSLDRDAAMKIYTHAQKDFYGSVGELHRLILLYKPITADLLASFPEYGESMTVYEFARAIVYKTDLSKKLTLWEYMCAQKIDGYMLFGYLAKMARDIRLITALARADELVKSGRLDINQALEEIIFYSTS